LKPFKTKDLLPSFAMEIERPVEEVQSVLSFYYKNIRTSLSNLESASVHLENLGTFYIKERALDSYIAKCEYIISGISNKTIKEYASKVSYQDKLVMLNKIKNLLFIEKERRQEVINKRFNTTNNEI
jgi:hypothetical protein